MSWNKLKSFKTNDYKCFKPENDYQGFTEIKPINVIIGKNNSGKSKILECFKNFVTSQAANDRLNPAQDNYQIVKELDETELRHAFPQNLINGDLGVIGIGGQNHWHNVGKFLIGKKVIATNNTNNLLDEHPFQIDNLKHQNTLDKSIQSLYSKLNNDLKGYQCLSLNAERDIVPEGFNNSEYERVSPDGRSATSLLARAITTQKSHQDKIRDYVQNDFRTKVNQVTSPDITFDRIDVLQNNRNWEIYLEEKNKGSIKLSDCGSGLKTVILVMMNLYLIPKICDFKKVLYFFEEIENNLHPSLERRLLLHIKNFFLENQDCALFLTTHSSITLNFFSNDEEAQIVRVKNDGKSSIIETVTNWHHHNNLLDDLGVKASDVLQSNCVVWLEGPSDRIYFNKWIKLFNIGQELIDGVHYECVFYGGSILAHHGFSKEDGNELIQMLKINRNAIILMDSDKANENDVYKPSVKRVIKDCKDIESVYSWVTNGREIENYLTNDILEKYFNDKVGMKKFDYFDKLYKKKKDVETFPKVKFASEIITKSYYTKENLENHLDLKENMENIIEKIRSFNS